MLRAGVLTNSASPHPATFSLFVAQNTNCLAESTSRRVLFNFFLISFANVLILNNLECGDRRGSVQIPASKGVTGKILQNKDLERRAVARGSPPACFSSGRSWEGVNMLPVWSFRYLR